MSRFALILILFSFAFTADAAPVPKAVKAKDRDADDILGTWRMVDHAMDGDRHDCRNVAWRFEGDGKAFCVHTDTGQEFPMGYALDPSAEPKAMEWRSTPNDKPSPAIYKLDGDTLLVVHPTADDGPRPTEFAAAKGVYYTEFRREATK